MTALVGLADSGSKFIHSKALKYKPKNIDVKVMNSAHGDLSKEGTIIKGGLATELDVEIAHSTPIAEITVVGNGIPSNPEIVLDMMQKAKEHSSLLGMSMNTNSAILYVAQEKGLEQLVDSIHQNRRQ